MSDEFTDVNEMSPEEIQAEIDLHMGEKGHPSNDLPYWNRKDPNHDPVVSRVSELYQTLYPPTPKVDGRTKEGRAQRGGLEVDRGTAETELRSQWGDRYDDEVEYARYGRDALLADETLIPENERESIEDLLELGGNHPGLIRLFNRLGKLFAEKANQE